jgi:hypothetical protein
MGKKSARETSDFDEIPSFPFPPMPYPILITRQTDGEGAIKAMIESLISNDNVHTLVVVAPYISTFFVKMLSKTKLKFLVVLVNRSKLNPEYVDDSIEALKVSPFDVIVRER